MSRSTARTLAAVAVAAAVAAASCVTRPGGTSSADSASHASTDSATTARNDASRTAESDSGRMARLEREARALAKTEGCARSEQCRVAPVGHRACGGPRAYLPYCALTTDSAALFAKLDELARAENEYQRRNGLASTCEMRMPPVPSVSGGRCVAREAGGAP